MFMDKKKLLMINLDEDDSKDIAKAITSNTCRKILDLLADKEHTASEIAQSLKLPLSTIHYNISLLVKAGLVVADEFHYSKKMKEVMHYKLANQYIIIAPKNTNTVDLKERLKNLLPLLGIGVLASAFIGFYDKTASYLSSIFQSSPPQAVLMVAQDSLVQEESTAFMARAIEEPVIASEPNVALWFLFGVLFIILILGIIEFIKYKRHKRK
jgi:DNA-binding transcriptional ArsR family regulator